jgi:hypothetical protein
MYHVVLDSNPIEIILYPFSASEVIQQWGDNESALQY